VADGALSWDDLPDAAKKQFYDRDLRAEELLAKADEWLRQDHQNQPFFLWIHLFDPHDPYSPPPPYDSLFDEGYIGDAEGDIRRTSETDNPVWGQVQKNPPPKDHQHIVALYDGEVRYAADRIGEFLERFSRIGLKRRTLIVFSSDHGESLGRASEMGTRSLAVRVGAAHPAYHGHAR